MEHPYVIVFTDGSSRGNPGPMGIGVVIIPNLNKPKDRIKIGKYIGIGTNNQAELSAIKLGIEKSIKYNKSILLYTDSLYCINVLTSRYKSITNVNLIREIKQLIIKYKVQLGHVKAHHINTFNNIADLLATTCSKTKKNYGSN